MYALAAHMTFGPVASGQVCPTAVSITDMTRFSFLMIVLPANRSLKLHTACCKPSLTRRRIDKCALEVTVAGGGDSRAFLQGASEVCRATCKQMSFWQMSLLTPQDQLPVVLPEVVEEGKGC